MRAFVALELPEAVREALGRTAEALRQAAPGAPVGWVPRANYHLTLRFLGRVDDLTPLTHALQEALAALAPPRLALGALGSFGGRRPRVVWVGLRGDGLRDVAAAVESACRQVGFPPEARPFRAHVTLGRVRRGKGGSGLQALARALEAGPAPAAEPWTGRQVVVFESVLERGRPPTYRPVTRVDLRRLSPGGDDGDETT